MKPTCRSAVRDIAGGKGLIYLLGPEGPHTLLIKIDAKNKYQRARRLACA